jgi:adenylate cyclase
MLLAARERRFLETAFGRYVNPVVVEQLKKTGGKVGSERRQATVLFSDIRGFTTMSAEMEPEEVISMLNDIMSVLIEVVARHEGYINKFIGDAMLVVWNAPLTQADHVLRATRCAQDMQRVLKAQNEGGGINGRVVEMGIGLHTGELVMGNLGNDRQVEFAVLGDTVNTASRVCSVAKANEVWITAALRQRLAQSDAALADAFVDQGAVALKGKGDVALFAWAASSASSPTTPSASTTTSP